jgi:hypothetical protein
VTSVRFATRAGRDRSRTRSFIRAPVAGPIAGLLLVLAGCGAPGPTAGPAGERCVDLGGDVQTIAWSQSGAFLAVVWATADGPSGIQLLAADGRSAGPVVSEHAWKAVVSGERGLAWLAGPRGDQVLVEDRPEGRRETELVGEVLDIAWTAIGYALLRRTEFDGSEVAILDVERPNVDVIHETSASIGWLWISADPEWLVLTSLGEPPDALETPVFEVIGATSRLTLAPSGANGGPASMPRFRRHLVYGADLQMAAIRLDRPDAPVTLADGFRGQVSDDGMLAYASGADPTRLCLVDVAALLP